MDKRKEDLIKKLTAKTEEGKIVWGESVSENAFQTTLPNMTIVVYSYRETYLVNILNSMDVVIEEITEEDVAYNFHEQKIKVLWELARRKALNVDAQIDELLSSLDGL